MGNDEFNEIFRERTKDFSVRIFKFLDQLPPTISTRVIAFQLGKSASSVGANFRAFCRGRSTKERFAKICIVVEEADETLYWLENIRDAQYDNSETLKELLAEALEILKIVATIKSRYEK
jgi:four helix bundle protein